MNYKLTLQYDGSRYLGWQKQVEDVVTVQGKIEAILSKMLDADIQVVGAGRTDAGVHALNYIANFNVIDELEPSEIKSYFDKYLPDDIVVKSVEIVDERFHARYNAKSKTYVYRIDHSPSGNVFERKYSWNIKGNLNLEKMREAAKLFEGTHDFKAFTNKAKNKNTLRTINYISIEKENNMISIEVNGDNFLLNQVRIMVGTLVDIGRGFKKPQDISTIIESGNRDEAGGRAMAKGLFLKNINY